MNIDRELFERLCVFFARLDLDLMKGGDLYLSHDEVRDILLALSRENFLRPEDVEKGNIEKYRKYGTDAVKTPCFRHDTGLEYLNNVPNDWPPQPVTSLTDLHKLHEDEERKKLEEFSDFCDEVKSRPQYKEGTIEAELKFWRDYNDNH